MIIAALLFYVPFWFLFSALAGKHEAKMFFKNPNKSVEFQKKWKVDIHLWFTLIRCLPGGLICFGLGYEYGLASSILMGLFLITSFPWFHDNNYYEVYKTISAGKVYPDGKYSQSTTTSAKNSFSYKERKRLLIGSFVYIAIIITLYFIK